MSNPGVITLANNKLRDSKLSVKIEDNIGEAIHFHFGEIRIDLTVKEFLEIEKSLVDAVNNLLQIEGFDIKQIDPIFLSSIASWLIDIERVEYEEIPLSKLKVKTKGFLGLPCIKGLKYSRVYKALKGNTKQQEHYKQENLYGQSNLERVYSAQSFLKENQYGYKNQYIVLFNRQNFIRDGQHRAACMFFEDPDQTVKVMRLHFKNERYNSSKHPLIEYLFVWNKTRVKKGLKALRRKMKTARHKLKRKIRIFFCKLRLKGGK